MSRGVTVGTISNGPRIMSSMFVYVDRPAVETSEMINDPDVYRVRELYLLIILSEQINIRL